MSPAELGRRLLPLGDAEIARFIAREALFVSWGMSPKVATNVADRLALRDQEGDDRRLCIECSHQHQGRCRARQPLVHAVLARCSRFSGVVQ